MRVRRYVVGRTVMVVVTVMLGVSGCEHLGYVAWDKVVPCLVEAWKVGEKPAEFGPQCKELKGEAKEAGHDVEKGESHGKQAQ